MGGGRHRVISIVGTRPEAIKMAPVARALAARGIDHRMILTGQHQGLACSLDLPRGEVSELGFDPRGRSPRGLRRALRTVLCGDLRRERADLLLVQGDTASALAGARAAGDCGIPIGHVEAGLRSFDLRRPCPEEGYRVVIDGLAELLFAPTERAAENLRREGRAEERIRVTGNTGIDALLRIRRRLGRTAPERGRRRLVLATCHRRENQGEGV
ncbi:MAG TPA: UDP-N-acetylglucosamine 2-epimerase, partial [Allosphingosinicella sp.]